MKPWITLLCAIACGGDTVQQQVSGSGPEGDEEDETPPTIEHDPITESQPYGVDVDVEAVVTDDLTGILLVQIFYKTETSTVWEKSALSPKDDSGTYGGRIPGSEVTGGGMHYYLYAVDLADNATTDPDDGDSDPFHFRVSSD